MDSQVGLTSTDLIRNQAAGFKSGRDVEDEGSGVLGFSNEALRLSQVFEASARKFSKFVYPWIMRPLGVLIFVSRELNDNLHGTVPDFEFLNHAKQDTKTGRLEFKNNFHNKKQNNVKDNAAAGNSKKDGAHTTQAKVNIFPGPKGLHQAEWLCSHAAAIADPCQRLNIAPDSWNRVQQSHPVSEHKTQSSRGSQSTDRLPIEKKVSLHLPKLPSEKSLALGDIATTNALNLPKSLFRSVDSTAFQNMHFFIQVFAKSCFPICSQAEHAWFVQAATDPAIFHGTLLVATSHQALKRGSFLPPECYYHRDETVRHINKRIGSPKTRTDDSVIGGIACLVAFENATDPSITRGRHVEGLERAMRLRYEHYQEEPAEYLRYLVHWVDLCYATANLTKPRFRTHDPLPQYSTIEEEELLQSTLNRQWGSDFPDSSITQYDGMDVAMAKLFHRLRQLSILATNSEGSAANDTLQQVFTDRMMVYERQVNASVWSMGLNNIRQHGSVNRPKASAAVRSCARTWHTTTLIYLYLVLRKTPPGSRVLEKLVVRFKISLLNLTSEELWSRFPAKLLLWALFIAGSASLGFDRLWLGEHLSQLRALLHLETWEQAKTILTEYAWVERTCSGPCKAFWNDAIRKHRV